MVGSIVHCSECGKPFHVEEGSEVMQVARPARWPMTPRYHGRGRRRGCLWLAVGCAAVPLVPILLFIVYVSLTNPPSRPAITTAESKPPQEPVRTPQYWMATLNGLPPGASMFGTIDPSASEPREPINLDNALIQSMVRLVVSGEAANQLTSENLGRIQIDRLALGYYGESKTKDAQVVVHLTGTDLDGHKRIVDFLRHSTGEKVQIEELDRKMGANGPVCISSSEWPFALKILDDHHAYLAASLNRDAKGSQHRKLLDPLPAAGIGAGYNPPWIKNALSSNSYGIGFFMGEIPAEWRRHLKEALKLRECPRSFVCHLARDPWWIGGIPPSPLPPDKGALFLYLTLNVEKAGADQRLRDDLEKWRPQALRDLQTWFPALKRDRQVSALLGQILNGMRWKANGHSVQTQVRIPAQVWKALSKAR